MYDDMTYVGITDEIQRYEAIHEVCFNAIEELEQQLEQYYPLKDLLSEKREDMRRASNKIDELRSILDTGNFNNGWS